MVKAWSLMPGMLGDRVMGCCLAPTQGFTFILLVECLLQPPATPGCKVIVNYLISRSNDDPRPRYIALKQGGEAKREN